MLQRSQTGLRIRNARADAGLSQKELAARVGISPSYLNLIEHDRRRIGRHMLQAIASELQVAPERLAAPLETGTLARIRITSEAVLEPAEMLAERFPGWAGLIEDQVQTISELTARLEAMSDRMTHDPVLSGALHQVLSMVTSIRSAASILVDGAGDRDWEARFHDNIHQDSLRLAELSQGLVTYLDGAGAERRDPSDLAAAFLSQRGFHFAELEAGGVVDLSQVPEEVRPLLEDWLTLYSRDAVAMPLVDVQGAVAETGFEPLALAQRFGVSMAAACRRLASLPPDVRQPAMGLAVCDVAGGIIVHKPIEGFVLPRREPGCAYLPLYEAIVQVGRPVQRVLAMSDGPSPRVTCHAIAEADLQHGYEAPVTLRSTMLVVADAPAAVPLVIGPTCASCLREDCSARRHPRASVTHLAL